MLCSSPHDVPQPLLLGLAAKDGVYGLPREGTYLAAVKIEVLRDEAVLVGKGAAEDAHVVGLFASRVSTCLFSCDLAYSGGLYRLVSTRPR